MALQIVEGVWEKIAGSIDLHGKHVRVVIDNKEGVLIRQSNITLVDLQELAADNPWLRNLETWAQAHTPLDHIVDDSRDGLYAELTDDPG